jgi:ribonuclease III
VPKELSKKPFGCNKLKVKALEKRLGYVFRSKELLLEALSHPSAKASLGRDYERLEFLGDRAIGLVAAEMLLNDLPKASEGELSKRYNSLVCKATLARLAAAIGLSKAMLLAHGEEKEGGRVRESNLANSMEAAAGAMYQDGGIEPLKKLLPELWRKLALSSDFHLQCDPKSALQEILQAYHGGRPVYKLVSVTGPGHRQNFKVSLELPSGEEITGSGYSKKDAEKDAACKAIARLKASKPD